ncbi:hypothetical protein GT037_001205, partial [Alternaria burnsii]
CTMATQAVAKSLAPTPKLPDLSGETIVVQVGNEVIHVHECLISSSSEFFKNATKPEWRTESRPIDLSDEQPDIFKRYCQWLYTGFIAPGPPGPPAESSFRCLAYMYVLGEKIIDYEFQNAVIQAMMSDISRTNVVKARLLASETGSTPLSFLIYHSLQFTDFTVPISNEMSTATATTCSTAAIVLVAPPENFEMPSLREDVVPIQPIDMSDVELTIFEACCGWLYTGKIVRSKEDDCFSLLAKLYVLGEKLMDTDFKSAIIAAIMRSKIDRKMYPCTRAVQIIYAGTPGRSPARRLMVDFWVFSAGPTWNGLSDLIEGTCPDFVNDLARELIVTRDRPDDFVQRPWIEDLGSYRVDSETK